MFSFIFSGETSKPSKRYLAELKDEEATKKADSQFGNGSVARSNESRTDMVLNVRQFNSGTSLIYWEAAEPARKQSLRTCQYVSS